MKHPLAHYEEVGPGLFRHRVGSGWLVMHHVARNTAVIGCHVLDPAHQWEKQDGYGWVDMGDGIGSQRFPTGNGWIVRIHAFYSPLASLVWIPGKWETKDRA